MGSENVQTRFHLVRIVGRSLFGWSGSGKTAAQTSSGRRNLAAGRLRDAPGGAGRGCAGSKAPERELDIPKPQ